MPGFLSTVSLPSGQALTAASGAAPSGSGGFLASVKTGGANVPALENKVASDQAAATDATAPLTIASNALPKISDIVGGLKDFGSDIWAALTAPVKTGSLSAMQNAPTTVTSALADSLGTAGSQMISGASTAISDHATALQRGVGAAQAAVGAVNAAFAPVSSVLDYAQTVPGLGVLASGLKNLFGALGTGGSDAAEGLVNALPLSDSTKAQITPIAQQIGTLAAQLAGGEIGSEAIGDITTKARDIVDTVNGALKTGEALTPGPNGEAAPAQGIIPTKLPVSGETAETPVPFANDYREGEPIQTGPKAPVDTTLPVAASSPVDVAPELGKIPGAKYSPVEPENGTGMAPKAGDEPGVSVESATIAPTGRGGGALKPIEGTGDLNTRGASSRIEALAIEKGLTDSFGNLPEYKSVNFKDQAAKVADLITKDPQRAESVALGKSRAPSGIVPEMVLKAVSDQAVKDGNVGLLRDLANGSLTYEGTTMGQRIAAYGQFDRTDPVPLIKEVQDARAADLKARGVDTKAETAKTVKEGTEAVKAEAVKGRQNWEQFIESITCKV